jgi:hypothetical protein
LGHVLSGFGVSGHVQSKPINGRVLTAIKERKSLLIARRHASQQGVVSQFHRFCAPEWRGPGHLNIWDGLPRFSLHIPRPEGESSGKAPLALDKSTEAASEQQAKRKGEARAGIRRPVGP